MSLKSLTGSRPPWRRRPGPGLPGFSQDLLLLLEDPILSPEVSEFFAFLGGEAFPLAGVDLGLLGPLPQRLGRYVKLSSYLGDRSLRRTDEPDGLSAEFWRVWWSGSRHLFSSPWTFIAKSLPVHGGDVIPDSF